MGSRKLSASQTSDNQVQSDIYRNSCHAWVTVDMHMTGKQSKSPGKTEQLLTDHCIETR